MKDWPRLALTGPQRKIVYALAENLLALRMLKHRHSQMERRQSQDVTDAPISPEEVVALKEAIKSPPKCDPRTLAALLKKLEQLP